MDNKTIIENKLQALKIAGELVKVENTLFYTDYIINFAPDVTINRISARQKDLDFLFGDNVIIQPQNGYVALRVANTNRPIIQLSTFQTGIMQSSYDLPLAIGVDDNNNHIIFNLCKLPHLLVAGATGSGKSVFLNNCILSLLMCNKCELILIDVKKVEFARYNNCNGIHPVIDNVSNASIILNNLCGIMDRRYAKMAQLGCRDFKTYRQKTNENYITVVIDELADIMLQNRKAVEKSIIRLAQLGRACGIHLILATQKPSTDIITSLIKSNIPSRISFAVASAVDSRVIIDQKGAEVLHGNGDGLFKPIGWNTPIRIQAPYISDENIDLFLDGSCR